MIEAKVVAGKAVPLGAFPHVKRVRDFIYVSGTSSRRPDNSIAGSTTDANGNKVLCIETQTRAVIENIQDLLTSVGADLSDVIDITAFLADIADFDTYNQTYSEFFNENGPTRTTVAVRDLPHPDLLIEIKAIAYKPA